MRQFIVSRAFIGLSLLLSCLVLHFFFSNYVFYKNDSASQSIHGLIHDRKNKGNEGQGKVNTKRDHSNQLILLSSNRSVTSDVQGNLGSPSVITSELVSNWLTDRWQGRSDTSDIIWQSKFWLINLLYKCNDDNSTSHLQLTILVDFILVYYEYRTVRII